MQHSYLIMQTQIGNSVANDQFATPYQNDTRCTSPLNSCETVIAYVNTSKKVELPIACFWTNQHGKTRQKKTNMSKSY